MGFYINPKGVTKEEFLLDKGIRTTEAPLLHRLMIGKKPHVAVCLVNNGGFTAAAIAFEARELARFKRADDPRAKQWFWVPLEALEPFLFGQGIEE